MYSVVTIILASMHFCGVQFTWLEDTFPTWEYFFFSNVQSSAFSLGGMQQQPGM